MRAVGAKRPREPFASSKHAPVQWTGRVPKPAMNKDSWVDYGSGFLRKSCDSCVSSKRRCDGQDPCTRCLRRKKPCHYTERKKCGPRSGQKAKCARATLPVTEEQKIRAHSRHPTGDSATRASHAAPALGESIYSGLRLGASLPPSHGPPSLAAGDLSGDTTGVDFTDCSDAPPSHHMLVRDESGGSWWSLEDQVKAQDSASCPAWARQEAGYGCRSTASHPNHDVDHVDDGHLRKRCRYESGRRWEDAHEATGGGGSVSGASGGSGCETSEDDISEEGLGQAEEEVAALLIHLWRSEPFVEDLSGEPLKGARSSPAVVRRTAHASRHGDSNKRCWNLDGDGVHGEGSR